MTQQVMVADRPSALRPTTSVMFWTMLAIIVVGGIYFFRDNFSDLVDAGGGGAIVALVGWLVYGAIGIAIVVAMQRYGHRPAWAVLFAVVWGAFAAGGLAQQANIAAEEFFRRASDTDGLNLWISTPLDEETFKAMGVLALALIPATRFRGPLDGLFYGFLVGIGFTVLESFVYTVAALQGSSEGVGYVVFDDIVLRGVLSLFAHSVYTALIGCAIGYMVEHRHRGFARGVVAVVLTVVGVMLVHGLFDHVDGFVARFFVVGLIPLIVLLVVLHWARGHEERRLARLGQRGMGGDVLTDDDRAVLLEPPADEAARRRRIGALKYLRAVDLWGPDSTKAADAAAAIPAS